jgi:hypothetical protein
VKQRTALEFEFRVSEYSHHMTGSSYRYLLRVCRPNQGTPSEIVFAAFKVAMESGISPSELLEMLPDVARPEIKKAAESVRLLLVPECDGIHIGAELPENYHQSSQFIPRCFIDKLYDAVE